MIGAWFRVWRSFAAELFREFTCNLVMGKKKQVALLTGIHVYLFLSAVNSWRSGEAGAIDRHGLQLMNQERVCVQGLPIITP